MLSLIFGKKKKKVMMIDDDKKILKLFEGIFKDHETIEIITVSSKEDFLANLDKVDAVVSDYHMRDVTDINFEKVRLHCDTKKVPLLLLSGDIYPYFDFQLPKPISAKTLQLSIQKMLDRGYVPSKKRFPIQAA